VKLNSRMSSLLKRSGISLPLDETLAAKPLTVPVFEYVHDSVLLKQEFHGSRHVKASDFPDRTGYESFINHVHLRFDQTRESLVSCLRYAQALQTGLARLQPRRHFQIIVAVGEDDCAVRFHEVRSGESWVAENLEGYSEAVLVLDGG
jgi:hypothetical protein